MCIRDRFKRSIFQTCWRIHSCAKFLSFELETSNFGSSYVFLSPLKWRGPFLPNLTFWTQKWHISGKMQVLLFQNLESTLLCQIFVFWARDFKFWLFFWASENGRVRFYLTWHFEHQNGIFQVNAVTIIPKSLFLEINAWNFGYSHVFRSQ